MEPSSSLQSNGNALANTTPKSQAQTRVASLTSAFIPFLLFNLVSLFAAFYAPIQDCDEVFNYWDPTHYLNHGFGLQTWEYSPEYAIRSWLYIGIHAIPGKIVSLFSSNGQLEFYTIRALLGLVCSSCQTQLYLTISREVSPRVAKIFMAVMLSSTGMFYASVAYLPSSFSMYTVMMGMSSFMDRRGEPQTRKGIVWFGIGAIVGWPFSAALIAPLFADELAYVALTKNFGAAALRVLTGVARAFMIVPFDLAVNTFFYRRTAFVPWRMVSYNVFSGSSRGPEIFGTEPWQFYIRNLLLNFNAWFLLAICAGPLLGMQFVLRSPSTTRMSSFRTLIFSIPFYLWLAIFSAQPHKEERFMYPLYPFLCFNAAVTLHILLFYLGRPSSKGALVKVPAKVRLLSAIGCVFIAVAAGMLRTAGTVSAYSAPLDIYKSLQSPEYANKEGTVCIGKEWYRFPSSFFLPRRMRAGFVKSAFDGLLPGSFSEASREFGIPPTWLMPPGMNDQNIEDPGKHIDINDCSFLVDSYFPGSQPSTLEPNHILDTKIWDQVTCRSFLDAPNTHLLARIFWIPDWDIIPARYRRRGRKKRLLCDYPNILGKEILQFGGGSPKAAEKARFNPNWFIFPGSRYVPAQIATPLIWLYSTPFAPNFAFELALHVDCYLLAIYPSFGRVPALLRSSVVTFWLVYDKSGRSAISFPALVALNKSFPGINQFLFAAMVTNTYSVGRESVESLKRLVMEHPRSVLYGGFLVAALVWLLGKRLLEQKSPPPPRPNSPDLEKPTSKRTTTFKAPQRPPGVWIPVEFKRPTAPPLLDWDVHKTKPVPYRPFKYGPYHITMGLRSMQWDEWIELDNHYLKYHESKARRIEERGDKCCRTAPEAMDGAIELLEQLCDYLPQRYPTLYTKTPVGMNNLVTGETFDILQRPLPEDPMSTAARWVQDDLAIMFEKADGQYYLLAGAILLPGFWRLEDKFGMPLSEIHTSGDVPGFRTKLEKGMMNFFRRVQPQSPVLRNNYFIQVDDELAWSSSIGAEDGDPNSQQAGWATAEKNKAIEHHFFRSERQSLTRLPRSGGVVFTIRTYFHPITEIAQEPGAPGRLASGVRSWGADVGKYKGRERYEEVLLEYLDKEHKKQVEAGLAPEVEDEDRNAKYPF